MDRLYIESSTIWNSISKVQVTKQNAQGGLTLFACLRCFLSDFSTISYHSHIFNSRFVGRVFPFLMHISETMWIMAIGTEMFFEIFSEMYILMSSSTVDTLSCLNMGMPSGHRTSQWKSPINGRFIRKSSVHEIFPSSNVTVWFPEGTIGCPSTTAILMGKIQQPSDTSLERSLERLNLADLQPAQRQGQHRCSAKRRAVQTLKSSPGKFDACDAALAHAVSGSGPNMPKYSSDRFQTQCWKMLEVPSKSAIHDLFGGPCWSRNLDDVCGCEWAWRMNRDMCTVQTCLNPKK